VTETTATSALTPATETNPPLWPPAADRQARLAAASAATDPDGWSLLDRFSAWPLHRTARAARSSLVAIALVIAVLRLPTIVDGEWANVQDLIGYAAVTLGWLLLASVFVRTITPRHVISCWLLGIFFAAPLVEGIGAVLDDHLAGNAFEAGAVPVLEELAKLLPVIGVAAVAGWTRRGVGAVDLAILGFAVGAGFALYEDMLWGRMFASGFDGLGVAFPTMFQDPVVAAGHAVWTASAALGVGLLSLHRRRRWAWFVAPVLLVAPWADHAVINYRGEEYDTLRSFLLDGALVPWLLLAGTLVALLLEIAIVRRSRDIDHLFAPVGVQTLLTAAPPPLFSVRTSPRQVQRVRNEIVYRHHVGRPLRPDAAHDLGIVVTNLAHPAPATATTDAPPG
jgi:RsiW-degrading membrane proteinase PrsW (M82 family)